jgi:hypothetical protein
MTKGGARNKSGPGIDPTSLRSAERNIILTALPNEGFSGEAPEFPLPKRFIWNEWFEGSGRNREKRRERDDGATEGTWERELDLWNWAWTTPQACAWALESWRWHTVAMWVRTFVICESSESTAADKSSLHRFADQIGLTPAGLKENGWAVAANQIAAKSTERPAATKTSARDRMKVVPDVGGA